MTMKIEVKNKSKNYLGKVIEIDLYENKRPLDGDEHILNPGESKSFYVNGTTRSLRIEEVPLKMAGPDEIPENEERSNDFREELCDLINEHNKGKGSNTPDFILAEYLDDCLSAYDKAVEHKDRWHMKEKPA